MDRRPAITVGTPVLVRNQFDGEWAPDFQIVAVESDGCRIRRNRDGTLLPTLFAWDDLRAAPAVVADGRLRSLDGYGAHNTRHDRYSGQPVLPRRHDARRLGEPGP
jgi:hypothetical protein